jgi:hypothetical protein
MDMEIHLRLCDPLGGCISGKELYHKLSLAYEDYEEKVKIYGKDLVVIVDDSPTSEFDSRTLTVMFCEAKKSIIEKLLAATQSLGNRKLIKMTFSPEVNKSGVCTYIFKFEDGSRIQIMRFKGRYTIKADNFKYVETDKRKKGFGNRRLV